MDWWNWIFSVFSSFLTQVPFCRCQRTKGCVSSHLTIPFENCLLSRKQSFFTAHFPLLDFGVPVCVIQLTFRLHHFLAWKVVIVRSFGFSSCSASPALAMPWSIFRLRIMAHRMTEHSYAGRVRFYTDAQIMQYSQWSICMQRQEM